MKINFLMVGKSEFPFVREGMALYEKRIGRYISYRHIEIPDLKGSSALSPGQIKEKEGELILKGIKDGQELILLDERGASFTSRDWAKEIEQKMISGKKEVTFVIGGAYGFSEKVYQRADSLLSLSKMTFSHQIVRLFFVEQLYRAFTIIKGEPYHND